MNSRVARLLAMSTVGVAVAATLAVPATADPERPTKPSRQSTASAPQTAIGLIVQTDAKPSAAVRSGIARAAEAPQADVKTIDTEIVTVPFDAPLEADAAKAAAAEMEQVAGVAHAEPNYLLTRSAADPLFPRQYNLWDARFGSAAPQGGFSVRAPFLWRYTRGLPSVRVAVIDTGSTSHPDLNANWVSGYDFLSTESDPSNRDGDLGTGNGWDADAADPGDYAAPNACGDGDPREYPSSWHGTHVAGIVAAVDNNGIGVTGVAPNVKVQPVRALGPCGGSTADIATAIKWAAGAPIPGVPNNPTPSKVINLSLGGGFEPCDSTFQGAIDTARQRGAVVVAAAGNEETNALSVPSNCGGVFAVVATNDYGQMASYTNLGNPSGRADLAAPGGDDPDAGYKLITSTINKGTTTPGAAGYGEQGGTSQATPLASGAAALLFSMGYSQREAERGLQYSVRSFPRYGDPFDCVESWRNKSYDCGKGLLDLAQVPAIYGAATVTGTAKVGRTVSTTLKGTGVVTPKYQWFRSGRAIPGATKPTYTLTKSDGGQRIAVRATVQRTNFKGMAIGTPSRVVAR